MTPQLKSVKKLLNAAASHVDADVTIRLWDGTAIEFNRRDAPNVVCAIKSAEVVRNLLLKPNVGTAFGMYGRGDLDIIDASPLALLGAFDHVSVIRFFKQYSKINLLKVVAPFLLKDGEKFSVRQFMPSVFIVVCPKALNASALLARCLKKKACFKLSGLFLDFLSLDLHF